MHFASPVVGLSDFKGSQVAGLRTTFAGVCMPVEVGRTRLRDQKFDFVYSSIICLQYIFRAEVSVSLELTEWLSAGALSLEDVCPLFTGDSSYFCLMQTAPG